MKTETSGATDTLRVTTTRVCDAQEQCPVYQVNHGAIHHRVIRDGDWVRLGQSPDRVHRVEAVTTDYGPHLGRFSIKGSPRMLAAVMLVLDNKSVIYVDADVEKICPSCKGRVISFNL